jgi:hypothetical protein
MRRQLIFTRHARRRMSERRVTEDDIQTTISEHHLSYTDPDGNRNFVANVDDRRIRVVVKGDRPSDPFVIITVIA